MANDPYYFTHDANAASDPKIKAMIRKYGCEGYGRYWIVIEMLRTQAGYKIEDKPYNWDALAEQMHCTSDALALYIKDCIGVFELFIQDEAGFIYSQSLLKRMVHLDGVRAQRVRAAEAMHKIRREKEDAWKE